MIAKSYRWQFTAIAAAVLMGLCATNAQALSLGRLNVRSPLGEPLKAEVEILDINAEEAATLSTKVAQPEAFKAAGLDYNAVIAGLKTSVQRRSDGRAYIQLSSDRIVSEPFVDLILEASWNTGRIVRDYTMLFDPPNLRSASTPAVTPAQVAPATSGAVQTPKVTAKPEARTPTSSTSPAANKAAAKPAANDSGGLQVTVTAGDTAGHIAAAHPVANVSLDQMLVAMLRGNSEAFIGGNVNRIKAGAVVTLPSEAQASETPAAQAKQIIVAQSLDFNNFRRNLAGSAPVAKVAPSKREASGKVQAKVEDKKPVATTPDKLTLSKGAVASKSAAEDKLALAQNAKAAASRATEVAKNLKDLSQIAAASSAVVPSSAAKPAPVVVAAPTSAPVSSAPQIPVIAAASAPVKPASKPAPAASVPALEPSFMDNLLEDPMVPAGAAGLIALLAGLGFYKIRQRKLASQDSTFDDSKLQTDSFFGSSGGKNVNTSDSGVTGSSMIYSPSQLDAVDDVDPVAEADVYLAYGRDLQAEEILKDALRTRPERLAIHQKLLEIYAKRRDAKAYEAIATLAFNLTSGIGQDWEHICEKGLTLDSNNALYLPGGQPQYDPTGLTIPASIDTVSPGFGAESGGAANAPAPLDASGKELDLDLDFSLDEKDAPGTAAPAKKPVEPTIEPEPLPSIETAKDESWSVPEPTELQAFQDAINKSVGTVHEPSPEFESTIDAPGLQERDNVNSIEFDKTQTLPIPQKAESPAQDSGMMAFDMNSLSLDFVNTNAAKLDKVEEPNDTMRAGMDEEPPTQPGAFPEVTGDPLETKLALAEEFRAIGDDDGARALIEEVISEATGDMKIKAQQALSKL